jgi:hypothetical protein
MAAAVDLHRAHMRATATAPPDAVPRYLLDKRRTLLPMTNNTGGSAPPLTLLKRKEPAMASFSDLIKSADALIRTGDYDAADAALDRANRLIDKANRRRRGRF